MDAIIKRSLSLAVLLLGVHSSAAEVEVIGWGANFLRRSGPIEAAPLTEPQMIHGRFQTALSTKRGKTCVIKRSDFLNPPNWTFGQLIAGQGNLQVFSDPTSPESSAIIGR